MPDLIDTIAQVIDDWIGSGVATRGAGMSDRAYLAELNADVVEAARAWRYAYGLTPSLSNPHGRRELRLMAAIDKYDRAMERAVQAAVADKASEGVGASAATLRGGTPPLGVDAPTPAPERGLTTSDPQRGRRTWRTPQPEEHP